MSLLPLDSNQMDLIMMLTVRQIMNKAKQVGMRFNPAKCQFKHEEVKFFGMVLNRQGVIPDPAKIEALLKLPEPKTETLLQSFLGMINYLSRFEPKIANLTHRLRSLLKKLTLYEVAFL